MKIIYKMFIFALIFRVMPIVILSMSIFPNTSLNNLDNFSHDVTIAIQHGDVLTIFARMISPYNNTIKINIPGTDIGVGISVSLTISALIAAFIIVGVARSTVLPVLVTGITGLLIIPFVIDTGIVMFNEAQATYNSAPLLMLMISMFIGLIGVGVITLLEMVKGTDSEVSDT